MGSTCINTNYSIVLFPSRRSIILSLKMYTVQCIFPTLKFTVLNSIYTACIHFKSLFHYC